MVVICLVCNKTFYQQYNLNRHSKKIHHLTPKPMTYGQSECMYKCLEKNCNSSFPRNLGLRAHLNKIHNMQFYVKKMEFSKREDFIAWKESIEKLSKSKYVLSYRSTNISSQIVRYYSCNRSGKVRTKCLAGRRPKNQGSCKLNRHCTSFIKVLEGEKIFITWLKTHYGHISELQHIRLPQQDKSIIASKLILGVPVSKILESYRDQIDGKEITRENLITRKDIQNMKKAYHNHTKPKSNFRELFISYSSAIDHNYLEVE